MTIKYHLSDEVIADVDMLGTGMEKTILGNLEGTLVIAIKSCRGIKWGIEFSSESAKPE